MDRGTCSLDLSQDRPYPSDAAARFDRLWASIAVQDSPPPCGRGYMDWLVPQALPASVCRGTTEEGRRFIAIRVRTFLEDGLPEEEGPAVGVAHERYRGNHQKWVWAGTCYGSLAGHADPDLVEALIAGRPVCLRGGMADGYLLVPEGGA